MPINKNYILWPLISAVIFIGAFLIAERKIVKLDFRERESVAEVKKTITLPETVRAIYLTSTSAANSKKMDSIIGLADRSGLNAVVIDIKDFSGYVAYDSSVSQAKEYKTERIDIKDIDSLVKQLHGHDIYSIARITVFQDPALVRARPDWSVKNKYTGRPWMDRKGLSWIDPACRECWPYYSAIAKDALDRGFDEINFDYIRFPSDGDMSALVFTFWNQEQSRTQVLNDFFRFMRSELGDARLSVDMFGFVTTRTEDFGVGQVMEDAFEYFDYISPMFYPSHYPPNFLGFPNPAAKPYEVIHYTMKSAGERLKIFQEKTGNKRPHIRPWLQDFDLGADYTQAMVEAEIKATQDALGDLYNGFMLWNARNVYHEGVFGKK